MKDTNELVDALYKTIDAQNKTINEQALEISQLKEELENDIYRYEDTISYQLGFDKGKEYLQQRIDKAIEYIKNNSLYYENYDYNEEDELELKYVYDDKAREDLLEILGDKE